MSCAGLQVIANVRLVRRLITPHVRIFENADSNHAFLEPLASFERRLSTIWRKNRGSCADTYCRT